jgi:GntR family transcriptional regulator/MocR family aminotransferase
MELHVRIADGRGRSVQVYEQIRAAILAGHLRAGDPVPPSRLLADQLGVSRNTVTVAYERLTAEGFLTGRVGSGTFVNADVPWPVDTARRPPAGNGPAFRPLWLEVPVPVPLVPRPEFDLRPGLPDPLLFPYQSWRRAVTTELRARSTGIGRYGIPAGHAGLRAAVAHHMRVSRALQADPDDIVITNGFQQGIDLLARVVVEPGTCVAVEDPGYPPARLLLQSHGAQVVGVPVDRDGLVVDALPPQARLVVVTPSHQFPLGMSMSLARRMALLAWARRHGAVVAEDDYDSEFRFTGRPLEPLQALDREGLVVYLGSFSKTTLPSLRLGFLVAPPSLRRALHAARYVSDWHTSVPLQGALFRLIQEGTLARHIRRMRREYRLRHRLVAQLFMECDWLEPVPSEVGIHLTAYLPAGTDSAVLAAAARTAGLAISTLSDLAPGATRPGLVVGYGAVPTALIPDSLHRLRGCLAEAVGRS